MPGKLNYTYTKTVKLFSLDDSMESGTSQIDLKTLGPYTYSVIRKFIEPREKEHFMTKMPMWNQTSKIINYSELFYYSG